MNKRNILVVFSLVLLSATLSFLFIQMNRERERKEENVLAAVSTNDLKVTNEIKSIVDNKNGSYDITYFYTIENVSDVLVYDINATSDLVKALKGKSYQIIALTSEGFEINPAYNGGSIVNLLKGKDKLQPHTLATITLVIRLYPEGDRGPFDNSIDVTGLKDGPDNNDDNNNDDGDKDNVTPTPIVTTTAVPSIKPSLSPSPTPKPSKTTTPKPSPTVKPSVSPTAKPSPTIKPTGTPKPSPTAKPSVSPTSTIAPTPSVNPTVSQTVLPSILISTIPSVSSTATTPTPTGNENGGGNDDGSDDDVTETTIGSATVSFTLPLIEDVVSPTPTEVVVIVEQIQSYQSKKITTEVKISAASDSVDLEGEVLGGSSSRLANSGSDLLVLVLISLGMIVTAVLVQGNYVQRIVGSIRK